MTRPASASPSAPEDEPVPGSSAAGGDGGPDGGQPEDGDESEGKPSPRSPLRTGLEWVAVIAGALVVALVIRTFLFANFWIPSDSMEPTLMGHPGRHDRVVVNKLSY